MARKKIAAVIPARMAASRFPGKPLAKILDLPMIEHVRRRVSLCEILNQVYVATCDREIADVVSGFGGKVIMTAPTHKRCTDRVEEAAKSIDADIIVIVQGDEPLFTPEAINRLVRPMFKKKDVHCVNLLSRIENKADFKNINIIKTVLDRNQRILYFSRAAIPFFRSPGRCDVFRQTGLSAFSKSFLHAFAKLPPTPLEVTESIDFLRILEHRYPIIGVIYDGQTVGVDRPGDVDVIKEILHRDARQKKLYQIIKNL